MECQRLTISGQAIAVAFDICSSSNIIDDLTKNDKVQRPTAFFGARCRDT
jgi:hypothetical protein